MAMHHKAIDLLISINNFIFSGGEYDKLDLIEDITDKIYVSWYIAIKQTQKIKKGTNKKHKSIKLNEIVLKLNFLCMINRKIGESIIILV